MVNQRPAPSRAEFDQLRATLHNCTVTGPTAQNHQQHDDFRAHLRGRIAWIAGHHTERGRKLLELEIVGGSLSTRAVAAGGKLAVASSYMM